MGLSGIKRTKILVKYVLFIKVFEIPYFFGFSNILGFVDFANCYSLVCFYGFIIRWPSTAKRPVLCEELIHHVWDWAPQIIKRSGKIIIT